MNAAGTMPKSLVQAWQFGIEINGFNAGLFTKGEMPKIEFEEVTFAPAGSAFDQKVAGRPKFDDLTFEMGVIQNAADTNALAWIKKQIDVNSGTGGEPASYMRDVDIVLYSRPGVELKRAKCHGAWVKKYEPGDMEGGKKENLIEKLTICYQYWD